MYSSYIKCTVSAVKNSVLFLENLWLQINFLCNFPIKQTACYSSFPTKTKLNWYINLDSFPVNNRCQASATSVFNLPGY